MKNDLCSEWMCNKTTYIFEDMESEGKNNIFCINDANFEMILIDFQWGCEEELNSIAQYYFEAGSPIGHKY